MTVCCYEFFGRRRPAPFCQQTNLVKFSSPKLKLVLQLPAKNFKEIVKIKCDNHKILDNFRQIKNYSEECPRHHNDWSMIVKICISKDLNIIDVNDSTL